MDGQLKSFHKEALERFDNAVEADLENREKALDDLRFISGEQWPEQIRKEREMENRPVLTINRMPQFLRQVTGDIRRTNPAIDVTPGDDQASDDMAEIYSGLIRHIEYKSDATSIYERSAESAAACGMGAFRVLTEEDTGGLQKISIEGIPNPFSVYWDPHAKDPTRMDAEYCFVTEDIPQDVFEAMYKDADQESFEGDGVTEHERNWITGKTIKVAEYFWKEDGEVYWCKLSGGKVLEKKRPLPTKYIPVLAVIGEEIHVGERVVRSSVIRYAKDSQRLYNYWRTAQTEMIALQPKTPYKITARQIEGHEEYWDTANDANHPYLLYNTDPEAPGAPQREAPPMMSSGMSQEVALAADDMKATTGIYDSALGEQGNEKSGVAIKQRQIESDISTSIYVDNLSKSIAQCGRIIVDMIPRIYDTTRNVRTLEQDGTPKIAQINQPVATPDGPAFVNDTSQGEFDVRIKTGPSYSTKRQESAESMMEFIRVFPAAQNFIGDLVARNMDWPGADEIADRLKKLLPPGVAEVDPADVTPEMQQQMMQQQAEQQQQAQMAQMMQETEIRKAQAETAEAEADAQKASTEAIAKQFELAVQSGQLNTAIEQAVAQALMARMPQ